MNGLLQPIAAMPMPGEWQPAVWLCDPPPHSFRKAYLNNEGTHYHDCSIILTRSDCRFREILFDSGISKLNVLGLKNTHRMHSSRISFGIHVAFPSTEKTQVMLARLVIG